MPDSRFRILVADDDVEIRSTYRELLEAVDIEIEEAVDGEEAFRRAQQAKFHLYLTDIRMPKMGGFEYISQLRHIDPDAVIVIISGIDDINYSIKAIEFGAWRYLIKPVNRETFYEVVRLGLRESVGRLPKDQQPLLLERLDPLRNLGLTTAVPKVPAPSARPAVDPPVKPVIETPAYSDPIATVPAPTVETTPLPEASKGLAPDLEQEIAGFRNRINTLMDDAVADFSRRMIEMKMDALREAMLQLDAMREKLLGSLPK